MSLQSETNSLQPEISSNQADFQYQQSIVKPLRLIASNQEAIAVAKQVAAEIAALAADPANNKTLPYRQAALVSQSG